MNILERAADFIKRLSVPHCEDCKHLKRGYLCEKLARINFTPYADACRKYEHLCGKHGRHFEAKVKR